MNTGRLNGVSSSCVIVIWPCDGFTEERRGEERRGEDS
jgi:hypothetical protein